MENTRPKKPTTALIMKGGGMKGIAYIGAIQELQRFYHFDVYAGTSAGAVTAVLLAAGYTTSELQQIMFDTDFGEFIPERLLVVPNLLFHGGLHKGNELVAWLDRLLAKKLRSANRVTLGQLPNTAIVYACRRDSPEPVIFDSRIRGATPASFAVRSSMSIPFFFTPERSEGLNIFDGGMRHNYPVSALLTSDPNMEFIGLYLGKEIYDAPSQSIIQDLLNISFEANDVAALSKYRENTIIIDPSPVSTLEFRLSEEAKNFLLQEGRAAALRFLESRKLINSSDLQVATNEASTARKHLIELRQRRRIRSRRSFLTAALATASCVGASKYFRVWPFSEVDPRVWGGVLGHGESELFMLAVKLFARPSLDGAAETEQLGKVDPLKGIFFWGNVYLEPSGKVDPKRSRISHRNL